MKVTTRIATRVKKHHTVELTGDQLRELLRNAGVEVSEHASITVYVPGGGDWSNQELDIDRDTPIKISWESSEPETVEEVSP